MKNLNASTIVIILLLMLNSATLAFMWVDKKSPQPLPPPSQLAEPLPPPHQGPRGPGKFLISELNFDEKQKQEFDKLREAHHAKAKAIQDSLHTLKEKLFSGIPSGDMTQASATADEIAFLQKQLELITYQHFKQVRDLCNAEQKNKFDKIINHVLEMMAPPPPPMQPNGPEGPPPPPEK